MLTEVGGQCTADADCPDGVCEAGACTRACEEKTPCPNSHVCNADALCEAVPIPDDPGTCTAAPSGTPLSGWPALALLLLLAVSRRQLSSVSTPAIDR